MATLNDIDRAAKAFADSRQNLCDQVTRLNALIERIKRKKLPHIKRAVAKAAEDKAALNALVDDSRELFTKPRTVIMHGIKVGLSKGKGLIEWDDNEHVAKLIKRHFPERFDVLVKTKHFPQKAALRSLSVSDLQKIGCDVEETGDYIVIKAVDSEVDKVVNAFLKDAEAELTEEAA